MGGDSLSHALLIATVEDKLKIEFTQRELLSFDDVVIWFGQLRKSSKLKV